MRRNSPSGHCRWTSYKQDDGRVTFWNRIDRDWLICMIGWHTKSNGRILFSLHQFEILLKQFDFAFQWLIHDYRKWLDSIPQSSIFDGNDSVQTFYVCGSLLSTSFFMSQDSPKSYSLRTTNHDHHSLQQRILIALHAILSYTSQIRSINSNSFPSGRPPRDMRPDTT